MFRSRVEAPGGKAVVARHRATGGAGAEELPRTVADGVDNHAGSHNRVYADDASLWDKIAAVARTRYGTDSVSANSKVRVQVDRLNRDHASVPVCRTKTRCPFPSTPRSAARRRDTT